MISGEVHTDHIVDGRNDKDHKTERVWATEKTPTERECIPCDEEKETDEEKSFVALVKKNAGRINSVVNYHSRCTSTCAKQTHRNRGKCKTCRLAVLRRESDKTKMSQLLHDRITNKVSAKDTIDAPPKKDDRWPLEPADERILAFDLRRRGVDNQQQIEASPIATACLRCNTSMQFCGDREGAKARGMYICSYSRALHIFSTYRSTQTTPQRYYMINRPP